MTLPNNERVALDAYWTPDACALACARVIAGVLPRAPRTILEPSAGGGAWVRAADVVWPDAKIKACDVDPEAPALKLSHDSECCDYLTADLGRFDLTLGNPPYGREHFQAWLERPLACSEAVAWLLRSTALGSASRLEWWRRNRPTHIWTLAQRPRWEGPGQRNPTDSVDSVLVLWQPTAAQRTPTQHDWLGWR